MDWLSRRIGCIESEVSDEDSRRLNLRDRKTMACTESISRRAPPSSYEIQATSPDGSPMTT